MRNHSHSPVVRALAAFTSLIAAVTAAVFGVPQAASAVTCATIGQVYYQPFGELFIKTERDPLDGPSFDSTRSLIPDVGDLGFYMGGNGLKPQTAVWWNVFDQNGTPLGNSQVLLAGSNCVANQKTILVRTSGKGSGTRSRPTTPRTTAER